MTSPLSTSKHPHRFPLGTEGYSYARNCHQLESQNGKEGSKTAHTNFTRGLSELGILLNLHHSALFAHCCCHFLSPCNQKAVRQNSLSQFFLSSFKTAFAYLLGRKNRGSKIDLSRFSFILALGISCPPVSFTYAVLTRFDSFNPTLVIFVANQVWSQVYKLIKSEYSRRTLRFAAFPDWILCFLGASLFRVNNPFHLECHVWFSSGNRV